MTTSGTYSFDPALVEVTDEAFERIGIDPKDLNSRHFRAARRSLEFMLASWANVGILLWAVDQVTVTLTQGTASYATPVGTTAILEMILRRVSGSVYFDTVIFPMQRDEYLAIPSKTQQGLPSRYYFDRTMTLASVPVVAGATGPTIILWSSPDRSTDQMIYYRLRRLQDAGVGTNTLDVPYRWQEALAAGLTARMAEKFMPVSADSSIKQSSLNKRAKEALDLAMQEDRQRAPTTMRPRFGRR